MKVVIDISADDFNAIYHGGLYAIQHDKLDQCITEAFQIAIIIPKGHGDLIDRNIVLDMMNYGILEDHIKTIPTVIEADKENHDE